MELSAPAVEARSLNHWPAREVPNLSFLTVASFLNCDSRHLISEHLPLGLPRGEVVHQRRTCTFSVMLQGTEQHPGHPDAYKKITRSSLILTWLSELNCKGCRASDENGERLLMRNIQPHLTHRRQSSACCQRHCLFPRVCALSGERAPLRAPLGGNESEQDSGLTFIADFHDLFPRLEKTAMNKASLGKEKLPPSVLPMQTILA